MPGRGAVRALAERHGIRPTKALGQNFLVDPNLARAIVREAGIEPGDAVLEIGAGMGSLTVALADAGGRVLAVEFDRALLAALEEVVGNRDHVDVIAADAMSINWAPLLAGEPRWTTVSNLPYNIATPLLLDLLEREPKIERFLVMVQREVGERLAAGSGDEGYGAVSVKVAYRAEAEVVRRVPASVFWPAPEIESVLVRMKRLPAPPVPGDPVWLFRVVEEGFAQRRKTMRGALRRLGLSAGEAAAALERAGVTPRARAEEIDLAGFARIARAAAELRVPGRAAGDDEAGGST